MFTPEMLESIKKVEATRDERMGMEPRRMTADEKRRPLEGLSSGLQKRRLYRDQDRTKQGPESPHRAGTFTPLQQPSVKCGYRFEQSGL